jgi:hypothetical protein
LHRTELITDAKGPAFQPAVDAEGDGFPVLDVLTLEMYSVRGSVERPDTNLCILSPGIRNATYHAVLLDDIEQDLRRLSPPSSDHGDCPGRLSPGATHLVVPDQQAIR